MKLFAHDLALARQVYADSEPEMTVRLPKAASAPQIGERIYLTNASRGGQTPTAECEAEVLAVAVVVRPDWETYRNPRAEREQGSLL